MNDPIVFFLTVVSHWKRCHCLGFLALALATSYVPAQEVPRDKLAHFENHVRPILATRCIKCHDAKKSESGLRLDSIASIKKGGDSGPAIITGKPKDSLLIQAVRHDGPEMPPDEKLKDHEIAALETWIKQGAFWPETIKLAQPIGPQLRGGPITDEERAFWSFQPVANPVPPRINHPYINNDIDRFVIARLRDANLKPVGRADQRTLVRRATFDLTGLPPTAAEIHDFLADASPHAFDKVIERLLASRAYGERWGRHWLDVVRYADTAGETSDYPTPLSYKYRNWVIDALNEDKPYDEFVREQIAGDILALKNPNVTGKHYEKMLTATGFIAISRRFGFDVEKYHDLTIQDTIDTVGQAILGLSLGCARCHDHKYDPVNKEDYYAWYGIFDSTRYSFPGSEQKKRPYDLFPALPPGQAEPTKKEFDAKLARLETENKSLEQERALLNTQARFWASVDPSDALARIDETAKRLSEIRPIVDAMKSSGPYALVYGAIEKDEPGNAKIHIRGNKKNLGNEVPRRNLDILGNELIPFDAGSGRLQLADWLTRKQNPLMARVMVNRIWQHHFGRGLVATENDFGVRGEAPTHPGLLDWIARQFQDSGFSMKAMHRLMMSSAAYQRSSAFDSRSFQVDPDAQLLWRFNRRRLSAEEIRDAMLFVSGRLDRTKGGEHPFPPTDTWGFSQHAPYYGVYPTNRRSVYLMQQRLKRHPFLALFDGADPNVSTARRTLTTVPTQSLFLMNNEFVHQCSISLGKRVLSKTKDPNARIDALFKLALGRPPDAVEQSETEDFRLAYGSVVAASETLEANRELVVWSGLGRVLLTRNEFLFID